MAANVESMFYVRDVPWHGLGTKVESAPNSEEALRLAKLDWTVVQEPIYTDGEEYIKGYKANIRSSDRKVLGIVRARYKVVQNEEAFAFTDGLLGKGVRYETAGSLREGRKVWMLARMPQEFKILGDVFEPYLVFSNSHDGSSAIRVAMTPVRVVCSNTLNVALATAKRSWSMIHTGRIECKMEEARKTLFRANDYMRALIDEFEELRKKALDDKKVEEYIEMLLPYEYRATQQRKKNIDHLREDLAIRYFEAPDLKDVGKNAYRFVNAVSDFATHANSFRKTENYRENLFSRTVDGNPLIDKAYRLMKAA